jgi:hypothetical protein
MKCSEGSGSRSRPRLRRSVSSHHVLCTEDGPYLADRGAVIRGSVREMLAIPKRVHESVALLIRSSSRVSAFALAASRKSAWPCWRVAGEGGRFPMKHGGVMAISKWGDQSKCHLDGSRLAAHGRAQMTCSMRIVGREERRAPFASSWQRGNRCQQGKLQDQDGRSRRAMRIMCVKTPTCSLRSSSGEAWFLPGRVSRVAGDPGIRSVGGFWNKLPRVPLFQVHAKVTYSQQPRAHRGPDSRHHARIRGIVSEISSPLPPAGRATQLAPLDSLAWGFRKYCMAVAPWSHSRRPRTIAWDM